MLSFAWKKLSIRLSILLKRGQRDYPGEVATAGTVGPTVLWGWALTFQKALKHMENRTLRLLIRALQLWRSHSLFLSVFLFLRPKDCNGFLRAPWDYSSTCKGLRNTYVNRELNAKASTSKSWENSSKIVSCFSLLCFQNTLFRGGYFLLFYKSFCVFTTINHGKNWQSPDVD